MIIVPVLDDTDDAAHCRGLGHLHFVHWRETGAVILPDELEWERKVATLI